MNPAQQRDEIKRFRDLAVKRKVRSYLEIGVQRGITFGFVGESLPEGSRMVGVDWPGARWGVKDGTGPALIEAVCSRMRERGHDVHMFYGPSANQSIIDRVKELGPYDLVFIDADHSYEAVSRDWKNYGPMGRMVAFHDIDIENYRYIRAEKIKNYGTHTLWKELREKHKTEEIIGAERGMGIGVLWRE